jgi:hypothetical protein
MLHIIEILHKDRKFLGEYGHFATIFNCNQAYATGCMLKIGATVISLS